MGMTITGSDQVSDKVARFFEGLQEDLQQVGETAASEIVRTTLAGIGEDDQNFAPYSANYQQLLDAVGGKPGGVVNLRGVFEKGDRDHLEPTQKRKVSGGIAAYQRRQLARGAGRRAYVTVTRGGRTFTAQTKQTRPALGLNDPRSEMSVDLIEVTTAADRLTLTYRPREDAYMVAHHRGEASGSPARPWFSVQKQAVQAAMVNVFGRCLRARAQWFNNGGTGAPPAGVIGGTELPGT